MSYLEIWIVESKATSLNSKLTREKGCKYEYIISHHTEWLSKLCIFALVNIFFLRPTNLHIHYIEASCQSIHQINQSSCTVAIANIHWLEQPLTRAFVTADRRKEAAPNTDLGNPRITREGRAMVSPQTIYCWRLNL